MTKSVKSMPAMADIANLAWPLAINAILLQSIIILDTYLVSILGAEALAAMGLAAALANLLLGAHIALSQATQIIIAQAQGAMDRIGLKSAFWSAITLSALVTGLGLCIVWTFGEDLLTALAPTPDIAKSAFIYIQIFSIVIACEAISQITACFFIGTGRPRLPFYSHLLEMPVNIFLSLALIFGIWGFPELGLFGAASGSAAAAIVRMCFLLVCLWRQARHTLEQAGWAKQRFGRTLRFHAIFALPVAATFYSQSIGNTIGSFLHAQMSVPDFAAMTLILPWIMIVGVLMNAWAQATGIHVGQSLGRRLSNELLNSFLKKSWKIMMVLALCVSLLYLMACLSFKWIYQDLERDILAALWSFTPFLVLLSLPKSSNMMCGNTLRAGGDTVYVMNIHLATQTLFRLPLTALLILYLDWSVTWVFALFLCEEVLKFPFFHLRFKAGKWRTMLKGG